MLAAWLRKRDIEAARKEGEAAERALIFEAERTRREGETLEDAVRRIRAERTAAR